MPASGFYDDDLRMMPSFHVLRLGDPLRGNGFRMMQNLVADFVFVETINESFRYFHEQSPIQIITFQGDLYSPDPAQDLKERIDEKLRSREHLDDRTPPRRLRHPKHY